MNGKRIYFLTYTELKCILLVDWSGKKDQQSVIDEIKRNFDAYRDYVNSFTLFRGTVLGVSALAAVFLTIMFVVRGRGIFPATAAFSWATLVYLLVDFGVHAARSTPAQVIFYGGAVAVTVSLTTPGCPIRNHFQTAVARAVQGLGVPKVSVAFDAELQREVALKQIKPERADDAESRARFLLDSKPLTRVASFQPCSAVEYRLIAYSRL